MKSHLLASILAGITVYSVAAATEALPLLIHKAEQSGTEITLYATSNQGVELKLGTSEIGCYRIQRKANLAACLISCDGKRSFLLSDEPEYRSLDRELDQFRVTGQLDRIITGATTIMSRNGASGSLELLPAQGNESTLCSSQFDGDRCLTETDQTVFSNDPLDGYISALESVATSASATVAASAPLGRIRALLESARSLRTELLAAGLDSFQRQGFFVAQNLKNAPGVICQVKSLGESTTASPRQALSGALDEDQAELARSLDMLRRMDR